MVFTYVDKMPKQVLLYIYEMVQSIEFYKQYQNAYLKYTELYGKQVCVFLKKGSFYEFYGQSNKDQVQLNTAKQVMEIFGIVIHIYPNEGPDGSTGYFGGVPEYTLDKWAGRLTSKGWTVIVIDEIKSPAGKIHREVTRILSPGTHIENAESSTSFFLASVWLNSQEPPKFGVAATDLTTGQVYLYEGQSKGTAFSWHTDDLRHFFQVYPPRELVLYSEKLQDIDILRRNFHIPNAPIHQVSSDGSLDIPLTRENYLRSLFKPKSSLPLREWLHITESSLRERALCRLLRFAEDHVQNLASCLQAPRLWHPSETLQIINNALTQLNFIKTSEQTSIEDLFCNPYTAMGKRSLTTYLCSPLTNTKKIQERHQQVEWALQTPLQNEIKSSLSLITDIARLHRNIQRGSVQAIDVVQYIQSYESALYLSKLLVSTPLYNNLEHTLENTLQSFSKYFDIQKAKQAVDQPQDMGFLRDQYAPNTKVAEEACQSIFQKANVWLDSFRKTCNVEDSAVYYKPSETSMFLLHATKSAAKKIESAIKNDINLYKNISLKIKLLTSNARIECTILDQFQVELDSARQSLKRTLASEMPSACIEFSEATRNTWQQVEDWIIQVDLCLCMGRTAQIQGWVKPVIQEGHISSVQIENLRHPLIEIQKTQSKYVTHNISLGTKEHGWLLYGMNASGKSSLMKAIGLSVLLAQVGSYVPATSMILVPFHKIATRILNQDNLWAGLSSFAVEMSELRNIFQVCDERTLVLGDELCSGTESISATAIVAAGIEWLHKCNSRFVLATHLHDLLCLPKVTSLPGLSIWHLHVEYDRVRDILVYHRTLQPGAGSSMYGLEVARALHLPQDMISSALAFRRELIGETPIEETRPSSWNSELIKQLCKICGAFTDLQAHHIQERHEAVQEGTRNIDGTSLHHPRNLIIVCKSCHKKHHSGDLELSSVEDTSIGPVQSINKEQKIQKQKRFPFTQEQIQAMQSTYTNNKNLHPKLLVFQIIKDHGFTTLEEKHVKQLIKNGHLL